MSKPGPEPRMRDNLCAENAFRFSHSCKLWNSGKAMWVSGG
jgi:hypothetical protein